MDGVEGLVGLMEPEVELYSAVEAERRQGRGEVPRIPDREGVVSKEVGSPEDA